MEPWYQSRRHWAAIFAIPAAVVVMLNTFGANIDFDAAMWTERTIAAIGGMGGVFALLSRYFPKKT